MTAVNLSTVVTGLPGLGTQLGDFMANIAPGLVAFILVIGIIGGIVAIIFAIVFVIKKSIKNMGRD